MEVSMVIGAALTCALSGVAPWVSAEVVLAGATLAVSPRMLPVLVVCCALAQIASKALLYGIVRWAPDRAPARARRLLGRAEVLCARPRLVAGALLSGALAGVPPLYLVTLVAGLVRLPLPLFVLLGLLGTLVRYGLVAWAAFRLGGN